MNQQNTETRLAQAYKEVSERETRAERLPISSLWYSPSQGTCAYLNYSIIQDQHVNGCHLTFAASKICFFNCQWGVATDQKQLIMKNELKE